MNCGALIDDGTGRDGMKKLTNAPARCHPRTLNERSSCVPSGVTPKGGGAAGGTGGFSAWRMIMIVDAKGVGALIGDSVSMVARGCAVLTMFDRDRQYLGR